MTSGLRPKLLIGLSIVLLAACGGPTSAVGQLDGQRYRFKPSWAEVHQEGRTLVVVLVGHDDPLPFIVDDETSLTLTLLIEDPEATPIGSPIDVSDPASPVRVQVALGCFCLAESREPIYDLTGKVTFTELSDTRVRGALELLLVGDVPWGPNPTPAVFRSEASLRVTWRTFEAPWGDE